jgi:hypothetical protein
MILEDFPPGRPEFGDAADTIPAAVLSPEVTDSEGVVINLSEACQIRSFKACRKRLLRDKQGKPRRPCVSPGIF